LSTNVNIIARKYKYSYWWAQVLVTYKMIRLVLKGVQKQLGIGFLEKMCVGKHVGHKVYFYGKDFVFMMVLFF
jgi:hypothetical protein